MDTRTDDKTSRGYDAVHSRSVGGGTNGMKDGRIEPR